MDPLNTLMLPSLARLVNSPLWRNIVRLFCQVTLATALFVVDPYGDLLFLTVLAFWDHHRILFSFYSQGNDVCLQDVYIPFRIDIAARYHQLRQVVGGIDQALFWKSGQPRRSASYRIAECTCGKHVIGVKCSSNLAGRDMQWHRGPSSPLMCSSTGSVASDGPERGHGSRKAKFHGTAHGESYPAAPAGWGGRSRASSFRKSNGDGDDSPRQPSRPNKTSCKGAISNRRRKECVRCPWHYIVGAQVAPVCAQPREFVSRLKVHIQSHRFYYCLNCFNTFDTQDDRDEHEGQGCSFKCITPDCPNFNHFPKDTTRACNHKKQTNSQRQLYRQLCRMAKEKLSLSFVGGVLPDVEMLYEELVDEENPGVDSTNGNDNVSIHNTQGRNDAHSAGAEHMHTTSSNIPVATSSYIDNARSHSAPGGQAEQDSPTAPLSTRLRHFAALMEEVEASNTNLDETTRFALEDIEMHLPRAIRQVSQRLMQTMSGHEWSSRSNVGQDNSPLLGAATNTEVHTHQPLTPVISTDYRHGFRSPIPGAVTAESTSDRLNAAAMTSYAIAHAGSEFPSTPRDTNGRPVYAQEVSPLVSNLGHQPEPPQIYRYAPDEQMYWLGEAEDEDPMDVTMQTSFPEGTRHRKTHDADV